MTRWGVLIRVHLVVSFLYFFAALRLCVEVLLRRLTAGPDPMNALQFLKHPSRDITGRRTLDRGWRLAVRLRGRWRYRLAIRRPLQLDGVALGIGEVDRDAVALGAEAGPDLADGDTVMLEVGDDRVLVEGFDAQAKVVHVAALGARSSASGLAQGAMDFDQIDEQGAHAQVRHAELGAVRDVRCAEDFAVEAAHGVDIPDAQDDVINAPDSQHGKYGVGMSKRPASGARAVRYAGLSVTDARDQIRPAWMAGLSSGSVRGIRLVVDDRGAAYPLTVDPLATSPVWSDAGKQAGARFGISVGTAGDVNGDGYDDVIVGAPQYDNGEVDEGGAWVFHGAATPRATSTGPRTAQASWRTPSLVIGSAAR